MTNLVYSQILGRKIRKDDWSELGIPTTTKIKEAIKQGRTDEALQLVDYLNPEGKGMHDFFVDWLYAFLTYVADNFGEEQLLPALRYSFATVGKAPHIRAGPFQAQQIGSLEEVIQVLAESSRANRHGPGEAGEVSITDEGDRYVLTVNPCGSGGLMRRGSQLDQSVPRTGPPYNLGVTQKAYPWSWGKVGVPYYCVHCCVLSEIIPTERNGYPAKVTLYPDNPNDACVSLFYKNPEDIPEEYFERIGFKKDISRIKKRGS